MKEVILEHSLPDGELLRAVFLPDYGMNLISLKKGEIEVIDQSTRKGFEERRGGLGALIGPHFHHRKDRDISFVPDETIFPHIARERAKGSPEPFSHGIGRYVPWKYHASSTTIDAAISGKDTYHGIALEVFEGFPFEMRFKAHISEQGLIIDYHVESKEKPSIAGLHYYYAMESNDAVVKMRCSDRYNDMGTWRPVPKEWQEEDANHLSFDLHQEYDYGFRPLGLDFTGDATLVTKTHELNIHYKTDSDEHAFQLYHPKNASFVSIEPLTAKNPREARQMKNHLQVTINIY